VSGAPFHHLYIKVLAPLHLYVSVFLCYPLSAYALWPLPCIGYQVFIWLSSFAFVLKVRTPGPRGLLIEASANIVVKAEGMRVSAIHRPLAARGLPLLL
jgi:hypothetical protein